MIAEAAIAALGNAVTVAHLGQIGHHGLVIFLEHLGARRNFQRDVGGIGTRPQAAHAVAARRCLEMLLVTVVDQCVETVDSLDPDVAAIAAVATVGPAHLDEFLAPERHGTRPAITGAHINLCLVEKFHGFAL